MGQSCASSLHMRHVCFFGLSLEYRWPAYGTWLAWGNVNCPSRANQLFCCAPPPTDATQSGPTAP